MMAALRGTEIAPGEDDDGKLTSKYLGIFHVFVMQTAMF